MNTHILTLASEANEAVIAWRYQMGSNLIDHDLNVVNAAIKMAEAIDKLTGAIVEEFNNA